MRDMREKILKVSTEYFSEKTYVQTTISDIANTLQINESTIYEYFKNKEEILLTIPFEELKWFLRSLSEHLEGIKGAENRLRKLVWHQLNFFQTHREYATILLLELRTNPRFYQSPAYELIKEYSKVLVNIVEEGKREGIFREGVNGRLVRDMIFGTLDHITLPWIIFKRQSNLLDRNDNLCDLFLRAIMGERTNNFQKMNKRDSILSISTKLFSKKGFNQSTISEIAKLVGIADSTIYEYFNGKEDILLTIPKVELELFLANLEELISPKGQDNRLKKLVWHQLNFFQTHREYTTILLLELRTNPRFYQSPAYELIKEYGKVLVNIVEEGKQEGLFREEVNARLVRDMIFGTLDHLTLPWIIFKRQSNLLDRTEELSNLFLNAIIKEKNYSGGKTYV
jgi:TetR/AcrR family transcriptional regulator, fatty acid metabolism regulator protein